MKTPARLHPASARTLIGALMFAAAASLHAGQISSDSYFNDFTSDADDFATLKTWTLNTSGSGFFGHNDANNVTGSYVASVEHTLLGGAAASASDFTFESTVVYTASGVASSNRLGVVFLASDAALTSATSYSFYLRGTASSGFSLFLERAGAVVASGGGSNDELRDYFGATLTFTVTASYVDQAGGDGINDALKIDVTLSSSTKDSISLSYIDTDPLTGSHFGLLGKDDSVNHTFNAQWDSVSLNVAAIPEPSVATLFGGLVALLGVTGTRRQKRAA